jgi:hypothetical protein
VPSPRPLSPCSQNFFLFGVNQKFGHMGQNVVYPTKDAFKRRLAVMTIREHLCGFYEISTRCAEAGDRLDPDTGHRVCCSCGKVTSKSGLRICDTCDREFINLDKFLNPEYETNCPECIERYGLDEEV